jgi:hypothetical protein
MTTEPQTPAVTEDFAVVYDGDALRNHRMSVRELAPALLALADLFQDINADVNPGEPPVSLDIRGTGEGSFVVDLSLVAGTAVTLLSGNPATALVNLKELVVGGRGIVSYIKNRGRPDAVEEVEEATGVVRLTFNENGTVRTMEYPLEAHRLGNNVAVRQRVREIVAPVTRAGIDRVDFLRSAEQEVSVSVTKDDAPAFYIDPELDEQQLVSNSMEMMLTIVSPTFKKDNKWRVSDGGQTFYAVVADNRFLADVDAGRIAFRKGDLLRAVVLFRQVQTADGLKLERTITRVVEHIPRRVPDALPFPNGEGASSGVEPA